MSELLLSISEMGVLKLQGKLVATANSIYDKTISSNVPEEKKEANYKLVDTILEAKQMIDNFVKLDAKRMSNNFEYIRKIQIMQKELDELRKENENLKENIC